MISLDSLPAQARQAFEGLQGENGRLEQVIRTKDQIIEIQDAENPPAQLQALGSQRRNHFPGANGAALRRGQRHGGGNRTGSQPAAGRKKKTRCPRPRRPAPTIPDGRNCRSIWSGAK